VRATKGPFGPDDQKWFRMQNENIKRASNYNDTKDILKLEIKTITKLNGSL